MSVRETGKSKPITTWWYDGPLRSIAAVDFAGDERMVEVTTILATVSEPFTVGRDENVRDVMVRFSREEVQQMLDLIDGKPVTDYNDEVVVVPR